MLTIAVPVGGAMPPALGNHPLEVLAVADAVAALRSGEADAALALVRDLRVVPPDGTAVAAVVQRSDPQAALFTRDGLRLKDLPTEALVGAADEALRRQLACARPESEPPSLMACPEDGFAAIRKGELDAFVAVVCGPAPEGAPPSRVLASKTCLHRPLDGIAALLVRDGDDATREAARAWHDPRTEIALAAEKSLLEALAAELGLSPLLLPIGGDCSIPGAYHTVKAVAAPPCARRGGAPIRAEIATETTAPPEDAGRAAADALLEGGAGEYLSVGELEHP